jgi:5-deoxy-glucuronate isomerase
VVLDIYSGVVSLETEAASFDRLGGRKNVFEGAATVIYLPPGTEYRLKVVEGPADIALFSATASSSEAGVTVIRPQDNVVTHPGKDNWQRHVYTAIGNNLPATKTIFGETVNPPGNWSSYPPHKHDAFVPPNEVPLEEIYYFQLDPSQGFGTIRVYTGPNDPGPMDQVYVVENGDTVVIPRGYHPVAAAPGYTLHYTWAMAGDIRKPGALSDDLRHAWVKGS